MNDLEKKLIEVTSMEVKAGPYGNIAKIKDQQNLTYSIFEKKKDNTISVAWQNLPQVGETVQIGFVSEEKSYEGKPYTQRTIRTIDADIGNGMANHLAQKTSNSVAPSASQDKSEQFWDMKAYKQCLWGYWLGCISNNQVAPTNWKDLVWQEFKDIEADAKKRFFEFSKDEPLPDELPTINVNEDVNVEDIPFN